MKYYFLEKFRLNLQSFSRAAFLSMGCLLLSSVGSQGMAQTDRAAVIATGGEGQAVGAIAQSPNNTANLPESVRTAVIQDAARRTGLPTNRFEVVTAEQQDWPDGCLGIAEPDTACTQVIVPGWRVVVSANQQQWVYRTDDTGSQVKLADSSTAPNGEQSYTDIQGYWAQSCLQRLSQAGVVSGYPDNTFRPNNPITRAEYAALINQAFPNVEAERSAIPFTDVPADFWGQSAIQTAYRKGFLAGYPNQVFRPNQLISRVETYVALASGLDYATPNNPTAILTSAYTDASRIPDYATGKIAAATQQGIVVNAAAGSSALNPSDPATRAQIAATLCQINYDNAGIPDSYVFNPGESPENSNAISLGQTCTNETAGYTVQYPTDWMTNAGEVIETCQVFDPESITLPEQSSSFDEAIHLRVDNVSFDEATGEDDITQTILTRSTTTIDGREAVVTEGESTGRGLLPAGIRTYTYIINLDDGDILVATTYDVEGQQYARNQQVLDQMVSSLTFNR